MRLSCGLVFEAQGAGFRFVFAVSWLGTCGNHIFFRLGPCVAGIGHMNKFEHF